MEHQYAQEGWASIRLSELQRLKDKLKTAEAEIERLGKENVLLLWEKDLGDPFQEIRKQKQEIAALKAELENA